MLGKRESVLTLLSETDSGVRSDDSSDKERKSTTMTAVPDVE